MAMRYFCDQCHAEVSQQFSTVCIVYVTDSNGNKMSQELRFCDACTGNHIVPLVMAGPSDVPGSINHVLANYPNYIPS